MGVKNNWLLVFVAILIVSSIFYLEKISPRRSMSTPAGTTISDVKLAQAPSVDAESNIRRQEEKKKIYPLAKEIVGATGYINTPNGLPIKIQDLIGKKVILLDIWTYSCINCQRTLPYLKSWYEKYGDQGLEIISLHVPEFEFEKDFDNVSSAVKKFGIKYPVVLDNNALTASLYGMRYWPEEYLIDIDGFIVHKSVGEGQYDNKEKEIQHLLEERMTVLGINGSIKKEIVKVQEESVGGSESPEIYFGFERNNYLGNGRQNASGVQSLTLPSVFSRNVLYLGGDWNFSPEFSSNQTKKAEIVFKYKAKEVYFVASSKSGVRVKIYQDGILISKNRGEDVNNDGKLYVKEDRLYKLIKNPTVEEHILKMEVENPGLEAYTFTFG